MKVIYRKLPSKRISCVATIGVFDGIHLGHKLILRNLRNKSKQLKLSSLAVTFDVPPRILLEKKFIAGQEKFPGNLFNLKDKKTIFASENINYLWLLKTTNSLLKFTGKQFLDYLFKYFNVKHIIVGEDFRFGFHGRYNIRYLRKVAKIYGFKVTVVKKMHKKNKIISSSLIRRFIQEADFGKISAYLGRNFYIEGKVVKGFGIGKKLGFPTANIDYDSYVIPKDGVYSGGVTINSRRYLCAVNIGVAPTINKARAKIIEAYIINFKDNILGKKLKLCFIEKIRDEKKFPSRELLKKAISKDISYIKSRYSLKDVVF